MNEGRAGRLSAGVAIGVQIGNSSRFGQRRACPRQTCSDAQRQSLPLDILPAGSRHNSPAQPDANRPISTAIIDWLESVGEWRSSVARFVRDEEVPGSNPGSPTICNQTCVQLESDRCDRSCVADCVATGLRFGLSVTTERSLRVSGIRTFASSSTAYLLASLPSATPVPLAPTTSAAA